jgi:hypothetical protein
MPRREEDLKKSPQEKYYFFKKAHELINSYLLQGDFIASYLIAFSILEDRIYALYAIRFIRLNQREPSKSHLSNKGLKGVCQILLKENLIKLETFEKLETQRAKRNDFIHLTIWTGHLNTKQDVDKVVSLIRLIDKEIRNIKLK